MKEIYLSNVLNIRNVLEKYMFMYLNNDAREIQINHNSPFNTNKSYLRVFISDESKVITNIYVGKNINSTTLGDLVDLGWKVTRNGHLIQHISQKYLIRDFPKDLERVFEILRYDEIEIEFH